MPSILDVAREANVAPSTVSLVMNVYNRRVQFKER